MFYAPSKFDIPALERFALEAYTAGELNPCRSLLDIIPVGERKLNYILGLVEKVLANKTFDPRHDILTIAGASHCLPCAWTQVTYKGQSFVVKPAYYLDLAITTFTTHKTSVINFLTKLPDNNVILTCGGLDLYDTGMFVSMPKAEIDYYCYKCVHLLHSVLPKASMLALLPSEDIAEHLYNSVNDSLHNACVDVGVPFLKLKERDSLVPIDSRHFSPSFIKNFLE